MKKIIFIFSLFVVSLGTGYIAFNLLQPSTSNQVNNTTEETPLASTPTISFSVEEQEKQMRKMILDTANNQLPKWATNKTRFTKMTYSEDQNSFIMHFELPKTEFLNEIFFLQEQAIENTQIPDETSLQEACDGPSIDLNGISTYIDFIDPETKEKYTQLTTQEILCNTSFSLEDLKN